MKKAFTFIELIIVIIVLGVLSNITFDILAHVYKNYIYTKEMNKLNSKLDYTIEIISAKLRDRVRNSVIVTKYPSKFDESDSSLVDFKPIYEIQEGDSDYKILEWIGKDYEAKNGMWDESLGHIQTGWSGFVDLEMQDIHKTNNNPKEFNITTPDSNFTIVKLIDRNITASYGFDQDPFESNTTTLIFSGDDLGGDIVDDIDNNKEKEINHSYGWYYDDNITLPESKKRLARAVFAIQGYKEYINNNSPQVDLNITAISRNDGTNRLYSRYYLVRSAYAIVPIENNETKDGREIHDYNLTFVYNYQPWQGDWWNGTHGESNSTLLATHVTEIRFKKDLTTSIIRLYICIQSEVMEINSTRNLTLCKEKAIF